MKRYIGVMIAIVGIFLLLFQIYNMAKTQDSSYIFLTPIGLLLAIGGSLLHIFLNKKK